jgi:hypothetical protein
MEAMVLNGSGRPIFETDAERSFMTVVLPINRSFLDDPFEGVTKGRTAGEGRRTRGEIVEGIVFQLRDGPRSVKEVSAAMGYKAVSPSFRGIVSAMISDGTLEYTEENPFSSRQKIRLRSGRRRGGWPRGYLSRNRMAHASRTEARGCSCPSAKASFPAGPDPPDYSIISRQAYGPS